MGYSPNLRLDPAASFVLSLSVISNTEAGKLLKLSDYFSLQKRWVIGQNSRANARTLIDGADSRGIRRIRDVTRQPVDLQK